MRQVTPLSDNFYARWRTRPGVGWSLREDAATPPERLLQAVWQHQRLHREHLKTLDGRPVRVLHPGFCSLEGGPDFRGAVIQIGDEPPRSGDVEVDLRSSGWRAHGHDRNPNFGNVILHVVWDGDAKTGTPTTLALREVLDAPLAELSLWLDHELPSLPENLRGKCCAPLRELTDEETTLLLHEAAHVRLQSKAAQLASRARAAGWEQALWEGLFRGLGYKHNVWPMQNLAESRPRWLRRGDSVLQLQARLLGVSGLLPAELNRPADGDGHYLRRVWDCWWRERDEFADCIFPRAAWHLHGIRPANHPQRRVAAAAHWLLAGDLPARLQKWCATERKDFQLADSLLEVLQVERDEFWSWHWTFRSTRLAKPQPLLGETRATDLAINVILPWLWTRAKEGRNDDVRREVERRYFAWPAAEDNSLLRLARQRLLGTRRIAFRNAALQQGLLQIVRDFCNHSNAICEECRFPELVRAWKPERAGPAAR
ncbi:MAG: DUF2851 family protein [Verrucomicrobia bacterium]|nr:MAG: DUF2851 family protein [Verrucomicrobiota bacterium]